jgi:hypothetical protein
MSLSDQSWGRRKPAGQPASADEQAIARYRYMLKTAPPELIQQTHTEAFARLTPEQRQQVLKQIAAELPPAERPLASAGNATPEGLATLATRAEVRRPGAMERMFGGGGPGFGSMLAGSLLGSIAGTVIGSMIAREFFAGSEPGTESAASGVEPGADDHLAESDLPMDGGDDFGLGDIDLA